MSLRRNLTGAAIFAGVALVLAFPVRHVVLKNPAFESWLFRRGFEAAMAKNAAVRAIVDEPELRLVLCGTGSPLANVARMGPCAAVIAKGHIWVVDVGGGSVRNLAVWHLPLDQISGVLLTHFHSDHIEDLGEANVQSWIAGRNTALPVYGGPGVAEVVGGFTQAYAQDTGYRVTHHGAAMLPREAAIMTAHEVGSAPGAMLAEGETAVVLNQDGLKITAIGVNHFPVKPAYGYRFDYGGRSVVISGDTRESDKLAEAAKGTDVLVHEAQQWALVEEAHELARAQGMTRISKMLNDIQSYHSTPAQAAHVANLAGAKLLVLTHLTPPIPLLLAEPAFMGEVQKERAAGSMLGFDGLMVSLPANSGAIDVGQLN
jgi:ribonuclease Z